MSIGRQRNSRTNNLVETVEDPSVRNALDANNRQMLAVLTQLRATNYAVSQTVTQLVTTPAKVLNLEVTLPSTGRAVAIALIPAPPTAPRATGNGSYIGLTPANLGAPNRLYAQIELYKAGVSIFRNLIEAGWSVSSGLNHIRYPAFMFLGFEVPPAGKQKYEVFVTSLPADGVLVLGAVQLLAIEL